MNTKQIKKVINGILLALFGLFDLILVIRILLKLIGASTESSFVRFWYSLSDPLFQAFSGTLEDLTAGNIVIEINSVIAFVMYSILALVSIKIVNAFFRDSMREKAVELLDGGFKVTEIILGVRMLMKLIGAKRSSFIKLLYSLSSPFYEPFKGLLPDIGGENVVFETSTFIAIIILMLLDFATDKLLEEVFKESSAGGMSSASVQPNPSPAGPEPVSKVKPQQPVQATKPAMPTSTPADNAGQTQSSQTAPTTVNINYPNQGNTGNTAPQMQNQQPQPVQPPSQSVSNPVGQVSQPQVPNQKTTNPNQQMTSANQGMSSASADDSNPLTKSPGQASNVPNQPLVSQSQNQNQNQNQSPNPAGNDQNQNLGGSGQVAGQPANASGQLSQGNSLPNQQTNQNPTEDNASNQGSSQSVGSNPVNIPQN